MTYNYLIFAILMTIVFIGILFVVNVVSIANIVGDMVSKAFALNQKACNTTSFILSQAIITAWLLFIVILALMGMFDYLVNFL